MLLHRLGNRAWLRRTLQSFQRFWTMGAEFMEVIF